MNKKKLEIARKQIDLLDKKIFSLIKRRTQVVKYMLSLKRFKNEILTLFNFFNSDTINSKKSSIIIDEDFLEKPKF